MVDLIRIKLGMGVGQRCITKAVYVFQVGLGDRGGLSLKRDCRGMWRVPHTRPAAARKAEEGAQKEKCTRQRKMDKRC